MLVPRVDSYAECDVDAESSYAVWLLFLALVTPPAGTSPLPLLALRVRWTSPMWTSEVFEWSLDTLHFLPPLCLAW